MFRTGVKIARHACISDSVMELPNSWKNLFVQDSIRANSHLRRFSVIITVIIITLITYHDVHRMTRHTPFQPAHARVTLSRPWTRRCDSIGHDYMYKKAQLTQRERATAVHV